VGIPVIVCGGGNSLEDIKNVIQKSNASAAAAGSLFVFKMPHKAVLINYPTQEELKREIFSYL
jgi:cyclase